MHQGLVFMDEGYNNALLLHATTRTRGKPLVRTDEPEVTFRKAEMQDMLQHRRCEETGYRSFLHRYRH